MAAARFLDPAAHPSHVVDLAAMPSLGSLYAKALAPNPKTVLRQAARKLPGGSSPTVDARAHALEDVTYRVGRVTVTPEHLESYQQLVGEPVDEFLPAGFVHVLAFPAAMAIMVRPGFPLPVVGMIHLSNRVQVARVLGRDEEFEVLAWAQNLAGHARGTSVELVVEVLCAGQPVWRGVSTYLAKGKFLKGRGEAAERAEFTPPVPTAQWRLTSRNAKQYAAISGDRNPIHTSLLGAKAFGFPKPIAHGMYTAARALAQSRALRPQAFEWTVEFGRPVLLPGQVALAITPTRGTAGGQDAATPGAGALYTAWNAKSGKQFFHGQVVPLT